MSAPYVCPSCRRSAVRHAAALRRLSRTSKATFISFRSNHPRQSPAAKETTSASNPETPSPPNDPKKRPPSRADALTSLFGVIGTSDRYSRPHAADQALDTPPQPPQAPQPKTPQTMPVASGLQKILEDEAKTTKEAWDYFQRHYTGPDCPALKSPSLLDVRRLVTGQQFWKLQAALVHDWCAGTLDESLPSPVELVQRYIHLRLMRPELWHDVLWTLNTYALKHFNSTDQPGPSLAETMAQVMRTWDLLLKAAASEHAAKGPHPPTGLESPTPMWSSLHLPWNTVRQMTRPHRFFGTRLNKFLPAMDTYKANRIAYSALVTFDVLTRDGVESVLDEEFLTESRPFVVFIAHLTPGSIRLPLRPDENTSNEMVKFLEHSRVSPGEITALLGRITDSADKCMEIIGSEGRSLDAGKKNSPGSLAGVDTDNHFQGDQAGIDGEVRSIDEGLASFYYRRLARAYSQKKRLIIYDLWLEAYQALTRKRRETTDPPVPPKLYDLALEALMAMQLPEQAIKVWNKMIESGIKPTIKTWTAMIDGCGKAKDTQGMEQMWVRMLNSGFQPDDYAWSARVSGMMRAARFHQGLAVLDEMAKIWADAYKRAQSAAKKKKTQVDMADLPARPNTIILNGAIAALASRRGHTERYLGRILAWAKSLEIQPDVFTYNSLISLSLNTGNTEEAMNLLRQMEKVNIKPDVATFSIIINSILRSGATAKLSQEEQSEKVMAVLGDLETHGIEATSPVYATLIDGLLKRHSNEAGARAVLTHMVKKGLQVPPHVFTSLMTHYFEHHDFEAVEALWAQIEKAETVVDIIFFDRMIEQYAKINDIDKMMEFLSRMARQGLTPGWPALQAVVVKLADVGDWERFEEIVNEVEQGVGIARNGMRGSPENVIHRFWKAVAWKRGQKPKPEPWQEDFPLARQDIF